MDSEEQRMQREGYARALRSPEVMRAIKSGVHGKIAIVYMEWASPEHQRVLVPWTVVNDPVDAATVADAIEGPPSLAQGGTSISAALLFAGRLLRTSGIRSERRIIDVSGDGPNNAGPAIEPIRSALINGGVTINGLAISLPGGPYMIESFDLDFIQSYYENCLIGGPGAFALSVGDPMDFERAVRLKLVSEIANTPPAPQLEYSRVPDCVEHDK
jgi:hypothetical protein